MAQEGREIIYIPGNHDDPLRRYCGHSFCGIEIHANAIHVTANQKKLLVLHGDEFDSAIKCHGLLSFVGHYAYSFILSLNRFTNYLRNKAGLGYWSLASHLKARSKKAVTYIERFERAASTAAKRENVDGIICGHIHRPKLEYMDGVLYCNDGDWVENCSYLVEHRDGTLEILRWHERSMPERVTPRPLAA